MGARELFFFKCLNFKACAHFIQTPFHVPLRPTKKEKDIKKRKINRTNRRLVLLLSPKQLPSPPLFLSVLTASFPLPPHQPAAQKERDVLLACVTLSFQPWAVLLHSIEKSGSSGHRLICGIQRLSIESHWSERNEGAGNFWKESWKI